MTLLFERPGHWIVEHTDKGIFFVRIQMTFTDAPTMDAFMDEARPHLERLQPVLYMNDATYVQDGPLGLQWRLSTHMKANARFIKRSAVFGLTPRKAFLVRTLGRASGRTNLRVFDTREECERWLLDDGGQGAVAAGAGRPSGPVT